MKLLIVSNDPLVRERCPEGVALRFVEGSHRDVLVTVRDLCQSGHCLLSHPLAGSVKPNETPYRSVLLSSDAPGVDPVSVELSGQAVLTAEKFGPVRRSWREKELADFRLIDLTLIESALESALADPHYF